MKVSKELFEEVFGYPLFSVEVDEFNGDILVYEYASDRVRWNRYELSHRCKEWASRQNIHLTSWTEHSLNKYYAYCEEDWMDTSYKAGTEPEAILKACEWILKETNNENEK